MAASSSVKAQVVFRVLSRGGIPSHRDGAGSIPRALRNSKLCRRLSAQTSMIRVASTYVWKFKPA
jgi:hypothetical protein